MTDRSAGQTPISDAVTGSPIAPWLESARALMDRSFVADFVPAGEPCVMTERRERLLDSLLAKGCELEEVQRKLFEDRARELASDMDCLKAHRDLWSDARVNLVVLSLGALEMDPTRWEPILRDAAYWIARERAGFNRICTSVADIQRHAHDKREACLMFGLQDGAALGDDPDRLDHLYDLGLRVVQLTYNVRNLLGDGCKEPADAGLSLLGRTLVKRMNELGVAIDTSHCGRQTTIDAIETSTRPVAVTHSFCRELFDNSRGKDDEVLRRLRDHDGYLGVTLVPSFFTHEAKAGLDDFVRHVLHAAEIVGIERVGVGSDFGWVTPDTPPAMMEAGRQKFISLGFSPSDLQHYGEGVEGFTSWTDWPNLAAVLLSVGLSETEVQGVIGGNWLSFLKRTL